MSESWLNLEGKTIIVTGGASGIGKAVAQGFLNAGSNVVISDMAPEAPEMDEAAGKLLYVKTDVTKVADVEAMVEKAKETFGTIDVLVNNAGINIREPIEEMSVENLDRMLVVNVRGPFLGIKHALPLLRRNGGGCIINMGSVCSLIGHKFTPEAYTTVKGALSQLTKSVAVRYAKDNVRANILCPSTVETPLVQEMMEDPERRRERVGEVPLGRLADMEDVASAAVYLASDEASFINGVAFPVDGGVTAW